MTPLGVLARVQDPRVVAGASLGSHGQDPEGSRPDEGQPQLASRLYKVPARRRSRAAFPGHELPLRAGSRPFETLCAASLRNPRGPGSAGIPTRRKGCRSCRKGEAEARPTPPLRKPGFAGQPDLRRRTANPRRGLAVPVQAAGASHDPQRPPKELAAIPVFGPKAAAPCCRRPEGRPGKAGGSRSCLETARISDRGEPEDPPSFELLLHRAEALQRGLHRRCPALSRAGRCSPETGRATI